MIHQSDSQVKYEFDLARCVVFDLECYPGRWCVGFLYQDHTSGEPQYLEAQDPSRLIELLRAFARQNRILVGYNSLHYDVPVIRGILRGIDPYEPTRLLIEENEPQSRALPKHLPTFPCQHIDVATRLKWDYVPKLGRSVPPGLKVVAANLGRPILRELPFKPGTELTDAEWLDVIVYNGVDLGHTQAVLEAVAPNLTSVTALSNQFQIDLQNSTDPQIVEQIFKTQYGRIHGIDPEKLEIGNSVIYIPPSGVVRPQEPAAADWFDSITQPIPILRVEDKTVVQVPKLAFSVGGLPLTVKKGGIHSKDKAGVWYTSKREIIIHVDVNSYYPSIVSRKSIFPRNYGDIGLSLYQSILEQRLSIKASIKDIDDEEERRVAKIQETGLKLILNSYSGKSGSKWSSLFDPEAFLGVTLTGQLMLIDLIERLQAVSVHVITANTDGLYLRIRRSNKSWKKVLETWQSDTEMTLSIKPIHRLVILASNSYATISPKGVVSRHGALLDELTWNTVPNSRVVNDAVALALLRDIPPEKTIFECRDMVRFCSIARVRGKATSITMGDEELPKVTRFYHQKDSRAGIVRHLESGKTSTPTGAKTGIAILQDLPPRGRLSDVDLAWYLREARRRIQKVRRYHHRSPSRLLNHPLAARVHQLGLWPVPKFGKVQPAGSDVKNPTFLWEWRNYETIGCYTGSRPGTLVIDVDDFAKFAKFLSGHAFPEDTLVSFHGDANPIRVRCACARGKLIFRFSEPANHPIAEMKQAKWVKKYGFEVFYGHGLPSILGKYDETDQYQLDGVLSEAPDWLVDAITPPIPKPRKKKPDVPLAEQQEMLFVAEQVLEGLPAELEKLNPKLNGRCNWYFKEDSDREGPGTMQIGDCPFHETGAGSLCCGVNLEGEPFVTCKHPDCVEIAVVNDLLRSNWRREHPEPATVTVLHGESEGGFEDRTQGGVNKPSVAAMQTFSGMSQEDLGIIDLKNVKEKPLEWLWLYRFARGELALMAGEGGLGKSLLLLKIGTVISVASDWPEAGTGKAPLGTVIILSAEDSIESTIKPRLLAMGANIDKIKPIKARYIIRTPGQDPVVHPVSLQDRDYWKAVFDKFPDCVLFIVDPIPAYLGRGVNDSKNAELRQILDPFVEEVLRPRGICMAANTHLNKSTEMKSPLMRITGTAAYGNIPRNVHFVVRDAENPQRRFFTQHKCNNAPDNLPAIAYRIEKKIITSEQGDIETVIPVFEDKTVEVSLNDHLNPSKDRPGPAASVIPKLATFLVNFMKGKGAIMLGEIAQVAGEAGFLGSHKNGKWSSFTLLYRASDAIPGLPAPDDGWKIVTPKEDPSLTSDHIKARWELRKS